jgi:aminoglycoside/choline kinase family phosphotransferase
MPGTVGQVIMKKIRDKWKPLIARVCSDPDEVDSAVLITMGGSDRSYYRLEGEDRSFVLLEDNNRRDLEDYILINSFYKSNGVRVPEILAGSVAENSIIVQDVGDDSLY